MHDLGCNFDGNTRTELVFEARPDCSQNRTFQRRFNKRRGIEDVSAVYVDYIGSILLLPIKMLDHTLLESSKITLNNFVFEL